MYYIDQNDKPRHRQSDDTIEQRLFYFDNDQEDYLLRYHINWNRLGTTFYKIALEGRTYDIPSGTYLLCGCDGGSQDWVTVDELIGKPIEVILINKNFRSWSLAFPKLVDHYEGSCYTPMTKSPIPVMDSTGERVIIISFVEQYHKLKDRDYDIFFV